jgi:hypothetical protein
MQRFLISPIVLLTAVAAMAAACSKGTSTTSPVSPSTPSAATNTPAPASGGAMVTGMVVTGSAAALASPVGLISPFASASLSGAGRVTVSVNGTSISVTSDDGGNFTLQNVPPGNVTLTISGNGFSAQVTLPPLNSNDQLRVTVRINGGSATLDDDEVESQDNKVELEGLISSVIGLTSSGGTIVVGRMNTSVSVPSTASITKGGTVLKPNDLVVGMRVHVRAMKSGSALTATTVIVQTGTPDGPGNNGKADDADDDDAADDDVNEVEFAGTITGTPAGSCATALTLMVGSTRVTVNTSTRFDDVACQSLVSGDSVKGEGTKQSDGSVLAKEIKKVSVSGGPDDKGNDKGKDKGKK